LYGKIDRARTTPYKTCPQEKKVDHFAHAQLLTSQMGSESMCRRREIRLLHAAMAGNLIKAPNLPYLTDCLSGPGRVPQPRGQSPALASPGTDRVPPTRSLLGGAPVAAEVPGGIPPRHCWSLWTDGRWPFPTQDSRRQPPCALHGLCERERGVRPLHPRPVCRNQPPPLRAARPACVRTGA
jgi:hypothetical protein